MHLGALSKLTICSASRLIIPFVSVILLPAIGATILPTRLLPVYADAVLYI